MKTDVKLSQQDEDDRKQSEMTGRVGVRLTRPESSTTSRWSAIKGRLRGRGSAGVPPSRPRHGTTLLETADLQKSGDGA